MFVWPRSSFFSLAAKLFPWQCEVFVCLGFGILFVYFFLESSKGPRMGRQFFKNVDFFVTYPLKGV